MLKTTCFHFSSQTKKMAVRVLALVAVAVVAFASTASASCCSGFVMDQLGINLLESSEGYVDHEYLDSAGVS